MTRPLPFVERTLIAASADGREFRIHVAIGAPCAVSADEWASSVAIDGLYDRLPDARGVASWQAFLLAQTLVHHLLDAFVEDGGRLRMEGDSEPISPGDLFVSTKRLVLDDGESSERTYPQNVRATDFLTFKDFERARFLDSELTSSELEDIGLAITLRLGVSAKRLRPT